MIQAPPALPGTPKPARRLATRGLRAMGLAAALTLGMLAGCSRPAPDGLAAAASAPITARASSAAPPPAEKPAVTPAAPPAAALAELPASAATAPTPNSTTAQPTAPLPPAIIAFQKRRDACDHFRGEEPYDKQRAAFLKAQLIKTCKGTDRALAALRQRFAKHPEALAALQGYEDRIE